MNKLFTKIAALALGAAMVVGVGVTVSSKDKDAKPVEAATSSAEVLFGTNSGRSSSAPFSFGSIATLTGTVATTAKTNVGFTGTFTFTPASGKKITQIVITSTSSDTYKPGGSYVVDGSGSSVSFTTIVGTYSDLNASTSVAFTVDSAARLTTATVTVDDAASGHNLTYAIGEHGAYDGSTTKTFSVAEGASHTVKSPSAVGISASAGYVFSTWNDGTSNYAPDSSYTMGASDVTLTAQWVSGIALSYNKNNNSATGSTDTTYVVSGGTQTVSACGFLLDGYQFDHWSTDADDEGISYDPDDEIQNFTSALTLYAIWVQKTSATLDPSKQTSGSYMTGNNDAAKFEVSSSEWSVVGAKGSASNMPAFYSSSEVRMYGKAGGDGTSITVTALGEHRTITKIAITFSGTYSTGATVYEGSTSGSVITESDGFYTFGSNVKSFVLKNTNNGTTQVRFQSIEIYYHDESVSTPEISLADTPNIVGVGTNTAFFTVNYNALTTAFSVSTDTTYVTASYTGATGTGSATVNLSGVTATNSTTITVSSTGAESKSFTVAVETLPIIDTNLSSMSWGSTSYATSPHTLTWNSSYTWGVSAGQFNSGIGYVGANSNNKQYTTVGGDDWTMTGAEFSSLNSAMETADGGSSYWSTYGSAFRMLNFGVVHPTAFSVTAGTVGNDADKYYLFASTNSGESWTYLGGDSTIAAGTAMTWSNSSTYASETNPVQFALVFTGSTAGKTISNVAIKVWADSYATTKVLDSIYIDGNPKTSYKVGEAFDLNGATVKARYTDSTTYPDENITSSVVWTSIEHETSTVTGSYGGKDVVVNVTVTDEGTVYKKVLSTNELIVGAKVIIGTSNGNYTAGAQGSTNKNRNAEAAGGNYGFYDDGDIENYSVNTAVFTVGKTENGYTFYDGNGYIYAASSSDNVLRVEAELDENQNGEWSVSIANGVATIVSQGSNSHNTLNGNGTAFSAYASPTVAISLYSDVAKTMLNGFGETYLHMTDYTTESGYCKDTTHHYYETAKEALVAMGSAYIDELQQNDSLNALQARYEAWASAYGDTTPYAATYGSGRILLETLGLNSVNSTVIIVVASMTCLSAVGGYFFLRKRKEI